MTRLKELNSNFESLTTEDMTDFAGQWVGIIKEKIISKHNTMQQVQKEIKRKFPKEKALIGKIPENRKLILSVM